MSKDIKYDVAISFAEEDRNIALCLALAFELAGLKDVFYYPDRISDKIGDVLEKSLQSIYSMESRYAVVIVSEKYFQKKYAQIEFKAIQERMAIQKDTIFMIPVVLIEVALDEVILEMSSRCYIYWRYNPKEIAQIIMQKLGKPYNQDEKVVSKKLVDKIFNKIMQINKGGDFADQLNNLIIN